MKSNNPLYYFFIMVFIMISSCKNDEIKKPNDLISEDTMVDILYEMAIMEGIRLNNPVTFMEYQIDPAKHLFEKYKIDSLQFAESNFYYASDVNKYLELYQKIQDRIDTEYQKTDSISKSEIKKMETIVQKRLDTFRSKTVNSKFIKETKIKKEIEKQK